MGADLVLLAFEMKKGEEPNWEKAQAALARLDKQAREEFESPASTAPDSIEILYDAYESSTGHEPLDMWDQPEEALDGILEMAGIGLTTIRDEWLCGGPRISTILRLSSADVLVMGDRTCGDPPFEEWDAVNLVAQLELHLVAGFLGAMTNAMRLVFQFPAEKSGLPEPPPPGELT